MFDIEEFEEYPSIQEIIEKINKFVLKNKIIKISKIVDDLEDLLENQEYLIQVTYILSILAENTKLINESLIQKIIPHINSDNDKLKVNSIIILGFFILNNPNHIDLYFPDFISLLKDKDEDVRNNGHYFLHEFLKIKAVNMNPYQDVFLTALSIENNKDNLISLINYLNNTKREDIKFYQLFNFREISESLILEYSKDKTSDIFLKITDFTKKLFPSLKDVNFQYLKPEELMKLLDDQFIMKKYNFNKIDQLNVYTSEIKKSSIKNKEIYFYIIDKERNNISFFELEKEKLNKVFERKNRISNKKLIDIFSQIINNDYDLKLFMNMLIKLGHIKGYYSKLGYFYPYNFLKNQIINDFTKEGVVNLKQKFDFLPSDFIKNIISESKLPFLLSKKGNSYLSLKKMQNQISSVAAKNSIINLKKYREILKEEDFIGLIKKLPMDYLSNFHKGTIWLTNLGQIRIKKEINNSKIVGFLNLNKISEKLKINKSLLIDIIDLEIDSRSGIWDKNKEIFYFSKYVKKKIDGINVITDEKEKKAHVEILANELNIDKNHIISKIDENYKLIGEEIKKQEQITISKYLEKLGMDYDIFMNFINSLELNYFKKGDILIFDSLKIENAKKGIKSLLINNSKSSNFISLGNFDITSSLIEELIEELKKDGKLKGIFFEEENNLIFYTENGIRKVMLENSFLFSFEDLFYGKVLNEEEIGILKTILNDLINERKVKGKFNEELLTFSSEDLLFEFDYNKIVDDFGRIINNHIKKFDFEFQKIKKVLSKSNETIFPREIKNLQDSIDKINFNYVKWKAQLNAYVYEANRKLLKDQGYTQKGYENLSIEQKEEVKLFKEDTFVYDYLDSFNQWVKLFNALEQKYGKIIFLQKRLIKNPDDEKSKNKFNELLTELNI